jgi:hypothetical protein
MYEFDIELDNNTLDQYDNILSRFKIWSQYKREIRLNSILESNKKIEFIIEIEDESMCISSDVNYTLNNACAAIKSMKFIINGNSIESLKIQIKIIDTYYGKILSEILKSGISVKINQNIIDGVILSFYILDENKEVA